MADKVVSVTVRARTEGFVAGMKKAKASVDDLTKAASPSKAAAFEKLADKAAIAGLGVAAGIGVAVKRFADFDKAMSAVKANSGETGATLEALRKTAIKLGADSQFSATEAAEGINEMSKAGVAAKDILGGGLKGALDLAAAGQVDVAFAAESAATAMVQFRLDGSKVPHIADLMTNAANKAQGGVSDLAMALKQGGLVASAMGLSIEETTAGLAAFASAGLIGSDAGTSLKTMLQRLANPSAEAADTMTDLGIAAYDSAGNFVGLEGIAGQLKTAMQNLTPAQRDAAMATIFGSDAVRAANVLYNEGAEGIAKWTKEVTEQGAAAKQAATLTDNLMGDLERLGGAFDSVLIQTGSGANSGLRSLVQGLTGVVDAVGRIPGPVLLAGGALTSFALLAPKGILMWRSYTAQLDALGLSLDRVALKSPRAAAGLRALGAASAVAAGLTIVGSGLEGMWLDVAGANDEATESLERYIKEGGKADGVTDIMRIGFSDLGATIEHAFGTAGMRGNIMGFFDEVGTGFGVFGPDKLTEARAFFEQIDSGLAGLVQAGNAEKAAEIFQRIAKEAQLQGVNIDAVKASLPGYAAAIATAGTNAATASTGTGAMATETERLEQSAEDAKKALGDLLTAIEGLGSPVAAQRAATRDYEAAIDAASASVKENGKTLDTNSEKGRANAAALDAIAAAAKTKAARDFEVTESTKGTEEATKAASKALQQGRTDFIKAATAAGMTKTQAEALADQLELIPDTVSILVKQTGAEAAGRAIDWAARNRNSKITVTEQIISKRTSIYDNDPRFNKAGGLQVGPGTGTSDSILSWLSNGEYVVKAAAVDKYGIAFLDAINGMRYSDLPKFATGGPAGIDSSQFRPAPMTSASFDYTRLAAAVASNGGITVNVTSGNPDAAARRVVEALQWEQLNG